MGNKVETDLRFHMAVRLTVKGVHVLGTDFRFSVCSRLNVHIEPPIGGTLIHGPAPAVPALVDEDAAIARCVRMIKEGKVTSINGKELDIKGDTLCVHGDGPKALAFVQRIRKAFAEEGIEIKHLQN